MANVPTSFIGKAVAEATHMIANGGPFRAADDANVLYRENGKEQVLIGAVIPILVVHY